MIPSQKWAVQLRACCGRPVIKRLVRKSGKASFLLVAHSFYISTSFSFSNLFASLSFSLSLHLAREIKRKKNSEKSFSSVSSWRVLGAPSSASFTLWLLLFCYLFGSFAALRVSVSFSLSLSFLFELATVPRRNGKSSDFFLVYRWRRRVTFAYLS